VILNRILTYIKKVGTRLYRAFRFRLFEDEEESRLWRGALHYLFKDRQPEFEEVAAWCNQIYRAPIHAIYKKSGSENLRLFRRHLHINNQDKGSEEEERFGLFYELERNVPLFASTPTPSREVSELETMIRNLPPKLPFSDKYTRYEVTKLSMGESHSIPIYKDQTFWGIYIVGPNPGLPRQLKDKKQLISRVLSKWITDLDSRNKEVSRQYVNQWERRVGSLGTGAFNIEHMSLFLLRYYRKIRSIEGVGLFEINGPWVHAIAQQGFDETLMNQLSDAKVEEVFGTKSEVSSDNRHLNEICESYGIDEVELISLDTVYSDAFLLIGTNGAGLSTKDLLEDRELNQIVQTLSELLNYRQSNEQIGETLIDTYYHLIRDREKRREKTRYHTLRMVALADHFADAFGLDEDDKQKLKMTARLHDIGYLGSLSQRSQINISEDLEHPLIGRKMIDPLPLPEETKQGVATHHEWVNGQGTPRGLQEDDIPWTGKIIGLLEFVVESIEEKVEEGRNDIKEKRNVEDIIEQVIERADQQFDMILVPTINELLNNIGWKQLCALGTEDEERS